MPEPMNDTVPTSGQVDAPEEPTGQQQVEPQAQVDPELVAIQKEAGVELYDGDPELELLDYDHDEFAFHQSVKTAAEYKKQRLDPQPRTPPHPATNVPSRKLPEQMSARDAWKTVTHKP